MNENATPKQVASPVTEPSLTEWIVPPSPAEERKAIAKLFESFLVIKMQSGAIEVDPAKQIAELFVNIFKDATSNERLEAALDELNKQNDVLLRGFYLRVSEMRLKPVTAKIYDFMVELVHLGKINEARSLYALYSSGEIKSTNDLLEIEKQMVSSKEISTAAEKIASFLKSQNKTAEAEKLNEAIASGALKTLEDLKPWETMIITAPGGSDVIKTTAQTSSEFSLRPELRPRGVQSAVKTQDLAPQLQAQLEQPKITTQPQDMNFGQRAWEGVHRLDQQLRKMLGMR